MSKGFSDGSGGGGGSSFGGTTNQTTSSGLESKSMKARLDADGGRIRKVFDQFKKKSTANAGFGAKTTASKPFASVGLGTSTSGGGLSGIVGFGAKTPSSNLLGETASTGSTGFGKTSTPSKGFGTGFGTKTTASSLFGGSGFRAKTTSSNLLGETASTGFTGFGKTSTPNTGFGTGLNFPKLDTCQGDFVGQQQLQQPVQSQQGLNFPKPGTSQGGLFGQQQPQQPFQSQQDSAAALLLATATALSAPIVFGDERDAILTKWNQIQAFWGIGRGFYRKDGEHIAFTPQNHFCRFKAVGYSCLPTAKDEEGYVAILIKKKESEMKSIGKSKIEEGLHKMFGGNQALKVNINTMSGVTDDKTEITIYVSKQSSATGAVRRVSASELHRFMQQPSIQQQLKQQLCMEACVPRAAMTTEQVRNLLATPPSGIDPVIWEQAKRDNPDPKNLIPVPMIGFSELQNRLHLQEMMAKQHQSRLDILSKDLHTMQQGQVGLQSRIAQHKRKLLEMSHRVLQVVIGQEVYRKAGYAVQPEEEQLRVQLESLYSQLNAPTQFRSRLNELLSQTRMRHQASTYTSSNTSSAWFDDEALHEINQHLRKQQEGLTTLVDILRDDFSDLKLLEADLATDDVTCQHSNLPCR